MAFEPVRRQRIRYFKCQTKIYFAFYIKKYNQKLVLWTTINQYIDPKKQS
jgi:hypothetical protein